MNKIFAVGVIFLILLVPTHAIIAVGSGSTVENGGSGNQGGSNGQDAGGGGVVTCDGPKCTLTQFFEMLGKIYSFIKDVAIPLAVLAVTIGAILMMISGGNPNLLSKGKTIFWSGIIGLVLVLAATSIIDFVVKALKGPTNWQNPM